MTNGRKAFLETLVSLMEIDPKVILIYGDVGFSFMEPVITRFPNQTLNAGIAEQNMMGMAAGLARVGWKPWVYTMTNFILLRPLEQVRNDIVFPNENVKLIGVKGSAAYAFLGMSHNMSEKEENSILYALNEVNVNFLSYQPTEEDRLKTLIEYEYARTGAAYIRI